MNTVRIADAKSSYSPFVVDGPAGNNRFLIEFRMEPICEIAVSGARPTKTELYDAVRHTMVPVVLLDVVYVAAMVAYDAVQVVAESE